MSVTQADWDFAEKFRRGRGGKYDRDVSRMAVDAAAHRLAERTRIVEVIRNEARDWSDGTETALINLAEAIERGDHDR